MMSSTTTRKCRRSSTGCWADTASTTWMSTPGCSRSISRTGTCNCFGRYAGYPGRKAWIFPSLARRICVKASTSTRKLVRFGPTSRIRAARRAGYSRTLREWTSWTGSRSSAGASDSGYTRWNARRMRWKTSRETGDPRTCASSRREAESRRSKPPSRRLGTSTNARR